MIRVLMICHGNICRSTMAEFVLKHLVEQAGLSDQYYIASAATSTEAIGCDTHRGTRQKLTEEGIPFSKRKARQVTPADYEQFDYLICMDHNNLTNLSRIIKADPEHKISLLLSFAGSNREVADPWYTGDFDQTYRDVLAGCTALLKLREE